jgi:hypothetical protein
MRRHNGSDPGNAIAIDDPDVSAHHAMVHWAGDSYVIEDTGTEGIMEQEAAFLALLPTVGGYTIEGDSLYLDFINLFLLILRASNRR